jgi:Tol biopolymer transport system component
MSAARPIERLIAERLADAASGKAPEAALDAALSRTSRMRPLPRWLALIKEPPMRIGTRVAVGSTTMRSVAILALTIALIVATVAAIGVAATLLQRSTPRLPPFGIAQNGVLVYESDGDIYAADATGAKTTAIITGPTDDVDPRFSHDGTRFAFARSFGRSAPGLWTARADGTGLHPVVGGQLRSIGRFDWSPDGGEFVAFSQSTTSPSTGVINDDPTLVIVETQPPDTLHTLELGAIEPAGWVAWRPPDGREVLFTGHPTAGTTDIGIYAVRPDGTGIRTVADVATDQSSPSGPASLISYQEPQVSPDGSTLAYWSWETIGGVTDGFTHLRDIDTGEDRIFRFELAEDPQSIGSSTPRLSPDGKHIVVQQGVETRLAIGAIDGSVPQRAIGPTFSFQTEHAFDFSPDGTKVVLTVGSTTYLIDASTGEFAETAAKIPRFPTWQRQAP